MRNRFISFFVFQVIAWVLYFQWDVDHIPPDATRQKFLEVSEITPQHVNQGVSFRNNYRLILRNDGFFTRINADRTVESGLWKMNYDLPAIILTSAKGDHHYQIITSEDHSLNVREVNNKIEFARNLDQSSDLERLFSSSALHP